MEESTDKTITFLRARLLAERSVSRTARQRAHELEKRVHELEKQLKYVTLQRKKAEKATVDVLAILENHGRSDLSESFDSSSDQEEEMSNDFKDDNNNINKHVEKSKKVMESDTEGFSGGSEVESSRSLSWKSSKNSSSRFHDKYMDASRRRRNSFTSTGSSPRRVGKSCRQIRHREHRSAADVSQNDTNSNNGHHCEEDEGVQNSADVAMEENKIHEEKSQPEILTPLTNGQISKNKGTERDMEIALENQAQFIAQFEEEEKEQREWEDKFRENNGSITPESCDPGTHSDVTEERDEIKTPSPSPGPPHSTEKLTSKIQEITKQPEPNSEPLPDPNKNTQKNKIPINQNQNQRNFSQSQASSSQENPEKLGSVLEALEKAKLSLKQNMNRVDSPLLESEQVSVPRFRPRDKYPVPSVPPGLFRLPTDYYEHGNRVNSPNLDFSRLSLTNYEEVPGSNQLISRETFSRSSTFDDRFRVVPTFPYQETKQETPTLRSSSDLDSRFSFRPSDLDDSKRFSFRRSDDLDSERFSFRRSDDLDRRFDVGVGPFGVDPRLSVGPSSSGSYGRTPRSVAGPDVPFRTRNLYDDYRRPNM